VTRSEFDLFLTVAIGLCAAMIIGSLLRYRSRGASALFLASAFAAMGGLLYGLKMSFPQPVLILLGILVLGCLLMDFGLRAREQRDR
jgi:hypothetical protein